MLVKFLILFYLIQLSQCDTPANCTFQDAVGKWKIYTADLTKNCSTRSFTFQKTFFLIYPNTVMDDFGNFGKWTLIYNQGFEITINNMVYFGYFDFKTINSTYAISYCDRLQPNWYHDVLIRQWRCFRAEKVKKQNPKLIAFQYSNSRFLKTQKFGSQKALVDLINEKNVGWTAKDYPEFHNRTLHDIIQMSGGFNSLHNRPKSAPVTKIVRLTAEKFPKSFDWRNVNGVNFVSPVRSQGHCGSCYSFASAGMLEARYRIKSNNTIKPILSPQDVVECSPYSQGCNGGFPYLIAGKYAQDFGMADEKCNPYKGKDGKCSTIKNCKRYYATKYQYLGGFYGSTNEPLMRMELVINGPIAVGFEVYSDFRQYKNGIYHHVFKADNLMTSRFGFNPFELTNHAVLVVGYGETPAGEKYWIVKNSWGPKWGEGGYFKIRRGNDECGIESLAVASQPII